MYGLVFSGTGVQPEAITDRLFQQKNKTQTIVWREKDINPGVTIKFECPRALLSWGSHPVCSIILYPDKIQAPSTPSHLFPPFPSLWEEKPLLRVGLASGCWRSAQCSPAQWPSFCLVHKHPGVLYILPYRMNTWHISKLSSSSLHGWGWGKFISGCNLP